MYSLSSDKINRVPAQGRCGDHSEGCTSTFTVMLISEARSGGVEGWRGTGGRNWALLPGGGPRLRGAGLGNRDETRKAPFGARGSWKPRLWREEASGDW